MKILLINPPSQSPQPVIPLGLAYLAAALEKNNIPVKIIDAWVEKLDYTALKRRISDAEKADLIGITISSPAYREGVNTVQAAKDASPKSKIIVGGTHPSSLPEECLKDNPQVDFIAAGEGDELIVQLTKSLTGDGRLSTIKGLLFRDNGKIINNGCAEPVKDLDGLPFPARHLFPMFKYKTHPPYMIYNRYATMITSRGCPFRCTYCTKSVSGQNIRLQSADRIYEEIEFLVNKYKIKQIHFYDDIFTINKKRVELLCDRLISAKSKIIWSCVTRVDKVDESLLQKMHRAGCWLISYGVESGNQKILDNVVKGYSLDEARKAFYITKKAGIRTLGYFMAGLPGETYSSLKDTIELSLSLDPDFVAWSITALYPGSQLYQQALNGELSGNYTRAVSPIEKKIADVSSLSPYAQGHALIYKGEMPHQVILDTVDEAYRRFYFRFGYILKLLFKMRTLTEVLGYMKTFFQFLKWRKIRGRLSK